jgi:Big-like domain-containing protein
MTGILFGRTAVILGYVLATLALMGVSSAQAATTTTLSASVNPSSFSQNVTFTATIGGAIGPTGTVNFLDGTNVIGTGTVSPVTKTATFMIAALGAGVHNITAVYSGDTNNSASTSAIFPQVVFAHGTATTFTVSANPIAYGQTLGLAITVTGVGPTGTVTVMDGSTVLGMVTLASGTVNLGVSGLSVGSHSITAVYSGDGNNLTSTSAITTEVVNPGTSTTALRSSASPSPFGQLLTLTATIGGGSANSGTMQFLDNGNVLSTVAVTGSVVTFQTSTLAIGSHPLSAIFSGNTSLAGSSGSFTQVISAAASSTALVSSLSPSQVGQNVTFTATVSGAQPTGSVTFRDGSISLVTVALSGNVAAYSTATLSAGAHLVTAVYSGDASNTGSTSSTFTQTVTVPPVAIASSANPSASGQTVTFTVTVTGTGPTGTVTVFDAGNALGNATLSGGVATYATSTLAVGSHAINARYNGDANNASGFSALLTQTVSGTAVPQTGLWWNPAEGGRGYTIEQRGNNLFMAAYLYDASGRSTWYGLGPGPISNGTFAGSLEAFSGGQTLTGAFQQAQAAAPGGFATVTFTSATQGTLTWPEGTIPIEKFDFGPGGSAATQPAGTPQPGWWLALTEPGRGYSIEIQGGVMFLAAYMYDAQGNPVWYASGPAAMTSTGTYQGTWQQYGNGQTLTGSYQSPQVTNANAGNVTIQFSSTTAGILTFPDGRQVAIQRYTF